MTNSQTKSKQRVRDHGEVFTAEREVKAMCDNISDVLVKVLDCQLDDIME